ncbi:MAG TPA: hypothetical protein VLM40_06280, partial [Gemmata sp.]|nr:hypothetical protein [Gemmata sp.]
FTADMPATPPWTIPLATGVFDWKLKDTPDRMLLRPERYKFSGEAVQNVDGVSLVRVKIVEQKDSMFWVLDYDPGRGHLPIHLLNGKASGKPTANPEIYSESWVLDVKKCDRERYFPTRILSVAPVVSDGGEKAFIVYETIVRSLLPDYQPSATDFAYVLPPNAGVLYFRPDQSASFYSREAETIRPENLPKLVERAKSAERKQSSTEMPAAMPPERNRFWIWVTLALIFLAMVIVLWRRMRNGRSLINRPGDPPRGANIP